MNSQKELLELQTNVENQNNSDSSNLIEREQVEGTPLIVVGNAESGYMVTLGKYMVSKRYKTKREAIDAVNIRDYELLMSIVSVCTTDILNQYEKEKNESLMEQFNTEKGIEYKNSENPHGKL